VFDPAAESSPISLRHGRWEDVLADVDQVDAVITDAPYSERVHKNHNTGANLANRKDGVMRSCGRPDQTKPRRELSYSHWKTDDVLDFVAAWAPRNRGWFVCLSDHDLCNVYRDAYTIHGLYAFAPVGILIPGMTVRMSGDGPSSWMLYANVARPKKLSKWGTLPGGYTGGHGERVHVGGKPLWLMRALIRDYTKPGDLIVDPMAGAATTLIAAGIENRRCVGAEVDDETYAVAMERLSHGYTPSMFDAPATNFEQTRFGGL
jgi:site-specific DNA-methyltransferase (adenine-specific)